MSYSQATSSIVRAIQSLAFHESIHSQLNRLILILLSPSGNGALIWITASIEWNLGIIFACFHSVKPILSDLFPRVFGTTQKSHSYRTTFSERSKKILHGASVNKANQFHALSGNNSSGVASKNGDFGGNDGFDYGSTIEMPERSVKLTRQIVVQSVPVGHDDEARLMDGQYRAGRGWAV